MNSLERSFYLMWSKSYELLFNVEQKGVEPPDKIFILRVI